MTTHAITSREAGADWLDAHTDVELSPLGRAVADMLGEWIHGLYHLPDHVLRSTEWGNTRVVAVELRGAFLGGLATYDSDELTRLVFLAHDACVRVSIEARGPHHLCFRFSLRKLREGGSVWDRHPTIEGALARWREEHPAQEATS